MEQLQQSNRLINFCSTQNKVFYTSLREYSSPNTSRVEDLNCGQSTSLMRQQGRTPLMDSHIQWLER